MRMRRRAAFVAGMAIVVSVFGGAPPAFAFTEGTFNNFFGTGAGANDAGNNNNSFFGGNAGNANTFGSSNSFFGREAGLSNTTGSANAFFGAIAGFFNTTGGANAFFGHSAGATNTTACCNAFFGSSAGLGNTTGTGNAFFGQEAGLRNETGGANAFFGQAAGFSNTASNNSFFGAGAGGANTSGTENAFFGSNAGVSNTSEEANTFLGAHSDGFAGITNATALGHRAQASQSNALVLGSVNGVNGATSNVNVGIGTDMPQNPLHVKRTDGTAKVLVQEASATTLGRALFQLTNNGAARFRVENIANGAVWDFQSSGGGGSFVIDRVGGLSTLDFELRPTGELVLNNTVTATGFITSSDRDLKTDIDPADASKLMPMLRQLDISTWRFKNQPVDTINLGPMAQDFHRLFGMGTETTIDVRDLAALALVAAQVLDEQVVDQQKVNEHFQAQIDDLRRVS